MRINRIEITAFGKWRQKVFHFEEGNQLIYGGNEAGKSTIYQFIQAILFGFPSKGRKKKDYTPKDGAAYGGRVWATHPVHGEFVIERYRQQNRGKAKVIWGERVGGEELLESLINPLTKELFQQVFTFQQEQLSELDGLREKELHDALISLGITGSSQVFQKRQEYYQQAQQLFKKKGQKLLLNQQLNEWKILQGKIKEKQSQESEYSHLTSENRRLEAEIEELQKKLEKIDQKITLYRQQELNFSLYEEWQNLKENTLEELPDPQLQKELSEFYKKYQNMAERLEELEASLEKHSGMDQQSARYYFYLEKEEALKELQKEQLHVEHLASEQRRLSLEIKETDSEMRILESRWQWDRKNPPTEFLYQEAWNEFLDKQKSVHEKINQAQIRSEVLNEQQQAIDQEINELEQKYPFLLQKQPPKPVYDFKKYGIALAIGILISIFLPTPWRFIFIFLTIAAVVFAGYKKMQEPQQESQEIKGIWQEKLGQLDTVAEQLAEVEKSKKESQVFLTESAQQLALFARSHQLGTMDQLEEMQRYGQEVTDYQNLYSMLADKRTRYQEIETYFQELDSKFTMTEEWLPLQDKTLLDKFSHLSAFIQEMEQMKFARSYQQNTLLRQEINQLKSKQKTWLQQHKTALETAGLSYPSEVPLYLQKAAQTERQAKRLEELTGILTPLFTKPVTQMKLQNELQRAVQERSTLRVHLDEQRENRQRILLQTEELQKDGTLDELYQQESLKKAEIQSLLQQWGALEIAGTFLGDLSTEMSERQLPQLLQIAGRYLSLLTQGHYQQILLKENVLTLTNGLTDFPIYELSTGTKDQLIMAIRFAYLELESGKGICPIIIDDGWLHYDSQRKLQLAELLAEFGKKYQVICFSSDQEMVSYYQKLQQAVRKIEGA
jgi:uncharacterized protein YhaN